MKTIVRSVALSLCIILSGATLSWADGTAGGGDYADSPYNNTISDNEPAPACTLPTTMRPLINFGVGSFDILKNADQNKAADFRFEYRFGDPLFYVFKPQISLQATSDSGAGVFGGIVADWVFDDHWVFAPSFSAGLWHDGNGKKMGSTIEFRSQVEAGYRFDNDWRLTAQFSHMSNADIGNKNPGVEYLGLYLQIPVEDIFP